MSTYRVYFKWLGKHGTSRDVVAPNAKQAIAMVPSEPGDIISVWKLVVARTRGKSNLVQVAR